MRRLLILLCATFAAGCQVEADFSDDIQTEILSAEKYRYEIAAIDRLLFTPTPIGEAGVKELEETIERLAKSVREHDPKSKFLKVESLELKLLASRAGRLPSKGTGAALQNDWMRIRNNLFDDRAWFVRSANDLEYAAQAVPPLPPEMKPIPATPEPAPAAPKPPAIDDTPRETLTGRWQVTEMLANGEARHDEEMSDSIWSFDPPRITVRDPAGRETAFNFSPDGGYLDVMTSEGTQGWMKYELRGTALRIAFFDNLGNGKPASFEADPNRKDPMLLVVHLVPVK